MANKMNNWSRNLFQGLETTPNISFNEYLIIIEEACDLTSVNNLEIVWLESVGLDRDIDKRGFGCVNSTTDIKQLLEMPSVRVLKPLNKRRTEVDLRFIT